MDVLVIVLLIVLAALISLLVWLSRTEDRQNRRAESLLREAAAAMESFEREHGHFEASPMTTGTSTHATAVMQALAPNVQWAYAKPSVLAVDRAVSFQYDRTVGARKADRYILQTVSETGDAFVYFRSETGQVSTCRVPAPKIAWTGAHYPYWEDPVPGRASVAGDCAGGRRGAAR